jgi:hypothetical protein
MDGAIRNNNHVQIKHGGGGGGADETKRSTVSDPTEAET